MSRSFQPVPHPRSSQASRPRLLPAHRPLVTAAASLLCLASLSRCGDPAGEATDEQTQALAAPDTSLARTLKSIDLSPNNPVVAVDLGSTGSRGFKLIARYNDRSSADVTARATFTVDDAAVGSMTGSRFDSVVRTASQVSFARLTARYREGAVELTASTQLTVVWMHASGPNRDLFLSLPYGGPAASAQISIGTTVQSVDDFFAIDTTGSMGGEINAIRTGLETTVLPAVRAAAARDAWFGVGAIDDFPSGSYGSPGCNGGPDDQPFILLSPMTSSVTTTKAAVANLLYGSAPRGCGADTPEGQMEALYQIATGAGNVVSGVVNIPPHKDRGRGGVEFRSGAMSVVSMVSDASFHTKNEPARTCFGGTLDYSGATAMAAHTRAETAAALTNICARFVGVTIITGSEEGCIATYDMRGFATSTGARVPPAAWDATGTRPSGCASNQCCTGIAGAGETVDADGLCPLVFRAMPDGTGVGDGLASAINHLTHFAAFDVNLVSSGNTTSEDGVALPAGKTAASFLSTITAYDGVAPMAPAGLKNPTASGDHFTTVTPGSTLRFTIEGKNDFAPATAKPQIYKGKLRAMASGCADLDEREIIILVPAA